MNYDVKLLKLRTEIDKIDEQLIGLLSKRIKVVKKVGELKAKHNIPALDKSRWQKVLEKICIQAEKKGIPKQLAKNIYELIHKTALEIEERSQGKLL